MWRMCSQFIILISCHSFCVKYFSFTQCITTYLKCSDVFNNKWSRDSLFGVVTRLRPGLQKIRPSIVGRGNELFSFPIRPDHLWNPPKLLLNGHRGLSPEEWNRWGLKLVTNLRLVPNLTMHESVLLSLKYFYAFCLIKQWDKFALFLFTSVCSLETTSSFF